MKFVEDLLSYGGAHTATHKDFERNGIKRSSLVGSDNTLFNCLGC